MEHLKVDLDQVRAAIERVRVTQPQATTAEVIREYMGVFASNRSVPPDRSWNAQFGKLLSKHQESLGIRLISAGNAVRDALDHPTESALWQL